MSNFEYGVELHASQYRELVRFGASTEEAEMIEREQRLHEIGGQLLSLELNTTPEEFGKMREAARLRVKEEFKQ